MRKDKVELLAPAGSFDSLQGAINAGADAIYFGVEQLNMRTRSSQSFHISDIKEVSAICKKHGLKAYITLNTVMYEHDMQLLKTVLKEVRKQKIDAVIAADFAVIDLCSQMEIPLHISTQANISNVESVRFFSRYADVMVLARELTLKQVAEISNEIQRKKIKGPSGKLVRLEMFIHGALCMAVSGKCYMSLHTQNASANRGACIQNCRRPYVVTDAETGEQLMIDNEYIMSPKDLCTIDILDQLVDSGVDVLKIEGRTKGADYVQVVTKCYREALDAVLEGTFSPEKAVDWKAEMEKVYNRGFWEGYYLGRKLGEWTPQPGSAATEKKIYIGKGSKYYPKISIGEFILESGNLKIGDTMMVTGPKCGMIKETLSSLMVNGQPAQEAVKGDKITLKFATKVTPSDKLYKIVEATHA
jgi:putative protease